MSTQIVSPETKSFIQFLKSISASNQTKEEQSIIAQLETHVPKSSSLSRLTNKHVTKHPLLIQKLVEILIHKNGSTIAQQDPSNGYTMLHYATIIGYVPLVELLLANGAPIAVEDFNGLPPLAYAEKANNDEVISLLLEPSKAKQNVDNRAMESVKEIQRMREIIDSGDIASLEQALQNKNLLQNEDKAGATLLHTAAYLGIVDAIHLLINAGASIHGKDNENCTALQKAVIGGHIDAVSVLLLQYHCDPNEPDNDGLTALHHACSSGREDIVAALLDHQAAVDAVDNHYVTPLHLAVSSGQAKVVQLLLERQAFVNSQDSSGATPLHIAAVENHVICAEILLSWNADVNAQDGEGLTPLHHASYVGYSNICALLLKQPTISLDLYDHNGATPLHNACYNGHSDCAALLIQHGVEVNVPDGHTSPMHHAAFGGHVNCIKLLLDKGASARVCDSEGATPLHKASFQGHFEAVKLLIQHGADLAAQDEEGSTPIHKAAFAGQSSVVEYLLQCGAEVDAQDNDDGTPLHNASFNGHLECVQLLLASQANLNCADAKGASPLHLAALNGHLHVATYLVDNGAQIDAPDDRGMIVLHFAIAHSSCLNFILERSTLHVDYRDNVGRTPLYYAAKNSCAESCRLLISRGADLYAKDNSGKTPYDMATPSFQKLLLNALKERESQMDSESQKKFQQAGKLFNTKPKTGIQFLIEQKVIEGRADEIAKFLYNTPSVQKAAIGEYIGEADPFNIKVLEEFINLMNFTGLDFDDALRHFLSRFNLPGEAQKIDRMMERFAARFCTNNPGGHFDGEQDSAYILAFALIMLNTDAHSSQVRNRMTKDVFIKRTRPIISTNVPTEYLAVLYDKIVKNEIKMSGDTSIFTTAEKKGWCNKQGGRIRNWKKRWFVLKDNCLYYFKNQQNDQQPCGIIPLENLQVRTAQVKGFKNVFELYSSDGEIKACKLSNGQLVKGHHGSYLISAPSKEEMDNWIAAISSNVAFNPFFEMIKSKIDQRADSATLLATRLSIAEDGVTTDFQELHDACLMCSIGSKSQNAIKEAYGNFVSALTEEYNTRYFLLTNERSRTQTLVISSLLSESAFNSAIKQPADVAKTWQLDKAVDSMDKNISKSLRKDYLFDIIGHSLGGALALSFAQRLTINHNNKQLRRVITFGQPKVVKQKDVSYFRGLPLTRVVDYHDAVPLHLAGFLHVGTAIVLFEESYYSILPEDVILSEESSVKRKIENNHIEVYLRNLKNKVNKRPLLHQWSDRHKIK